MIVNDPFDWRVNDEDEVRAVCDCGWVGPWREYVRDVRADEQTHACHLAVDWRTA